ncbi:MAG: dihydroneopterin aldolase [Muribaculaceae bacterium]|nr:dihydroneopterin aldolase [Muribaculaceae bacterium]
MKITSSNLRLEGLKFHAFHGVLDQERKVGGEYVVDLILDNIGITAAETDNLDDTVNYAAIIETVRDEMEGPSDLIEHVAWRIARALLKRFGSISSGSISVTKVHPPVQAVMRGATYHLSFERD